VKNILEAMRDKKLFANWFGTNWLGRDTWKTWRAFLAALFALPMDDDARVSYKQFTGRDDVPKEQANEAWLICGRRSGKSRIAALIAVFLAAFRDYSKILAPGEIGTVMVIAADRKQARTILSYIDAFFSQLPILSRMVEQRTKENILLTNRIRIEVHTASFRSIRGYTVVAAVLDEIAFFATGDSAEPDTEIVNALRPAMATVPGALLLGISSPYAKRGVLWQAFRDHYGKANAPALVWRAPTKEMNPTVSPVTIAAAYLRDSASARAEYGAEFRSDIETFLSVETIERSVRSGRVELPPLASISYFGFVDPSGGVQRLDGLGDRTRGEGLRSSRLHSRGRRAVRSRDGDEAILRGLEALPPERGLRRPLQRRVVRADVRQVRSPLPTEREESFGDLS
jgi:hypothetical protein